MIRDRAEQQGAADSYPQICAKTLWVSAFRCDTSVPEAFEPFQRLGYNRV